MSAKVFGGTLALKGATEEQHAAMPHCEAGCVYCYDEVSQLFTYWLSEQTQYASTEHEHVRGMIQTGIELGYLAP